MKKATILAGLSACEKRSLGDIGSKRRGSRFSHNLQTFRVTQRGILRCTQWWGGNEFSI